MEVKIKERIKVKVELKTDTGGEVEEGGDE